MADEAKLPTEEEIAQLPRWARVAFAARCARRMLPMFKKHWSAAPNTCLTELSNQIRIAEKAATWAEPAPRDVFNETSVAAEIAYAQVAAVIANAAGSAVLAASTTGPQAGIEGALVCLSSAVRAGIATESLRQDFDLILAESRWRNWTDDSPVPPSVFRPLDAQSTLTIELFPPEGIDPHDIGDAVVKLWEVANEYHMARGGGVLTFDEFKQMMPALVPVGPKLGS